MTKPRLWPTNALSARDRASELAQGIVNDLMPLIENPRRFDETERIRRESSAALKAQAIARLLESVGAQTRP